MNCQSMTFRHSFSRAIQGSLDELFGDKCYAVNSRLTPFSRAAEIEVTGAERALMVVRMEEPVARAFAALMFDVRDSDVGEIDISNGLLKFTSIVAGAAKSILDNECTLLLRGTIPVDDLPLDFSEVAFSVNVGTVSVGIGNAS